MESNIETPLTEGEKWEAAEEAAISEESEELVDEVESEVADVDEAEPEDDVEVEADDEDEDEAEDEEEQEEEDPPAEAKEPVAWDGNPQTLPPELKPYVDNVVRGVNMKLQEVAQIRKELQAELERAKSQAQGPKEVANEQPPFPTDDDSPEEYNRKWAAINKYNAEQAARAVLAEREQSPDNSRLQQAAAFAEAQQRYIRLQSQPGYSDEIADKMVEIAQSDSSGYWNDQLQTSDQGTLALFELAKTQMTAASLQKTAEELKKTAASKATDETKRKAGAAKRQVSRPSGTRKSTPAENFKKMSLDELERLAREET